MGILMLMFMLFDACLQLSGLPETGGSVATSQKQPQAAAVADADADLQAR